MKARTSWIDQDQIPMIPIPGPFGPSFVDADPPIAAKAGMTTQT